MDNITGELETWRIKSDEVARALVFPPVNNYHRFLIHKVGTDVFVRSALCFAFMRSHFQASSSGVEWEGAVVRVLCPVLNINSTRQ